jgi:hypothetical protein
MTLADRYGVEARGGVEAVAGEELAQRVKYDKRLALVGRALFVRADDVVRCKRRAHAGFAAYRS